jgi:protein required for attachment to host cells
MTRICLVVVDATRARIYTYEQVREPCGTLERLCEERNLVDPARHERASELFSDNSGSNHNGQHRYGFDDHRQSHLDRLDVEFGRRIADEVGNITRKNKSKEVILVASSRMLGVLRYQLAALRRSGVTIDELQRNFTKLTTAEIRDRLAELQLLPARERPVLAKR